LDWGVSTGKKKSSKGKLEDMRSLLRWQWILDTLSKGIVQRNLLDNAFLGLV